ncbi:MAG: P-II family nitrogen regulator [Planctomycetes bacterium]|nr:P-II family nitrogen regulator [Planctomycetota bacterium]
MRLVLAILKPSQVESVRQALASVDVTRMTICDGQGWAETGGLVQQAVIELAVNDDFLSRTTGAIEGVLAACGETLDGRLFTLPLASAVQLYHEVRGPEAI